MIYDKLFNWQKSIIDRFKDRSSFGLFLDMGLGKTVISLAMAEANVCRKVIVISINSKSLESEDVNGSWLWWAKQSGLNYRFLNKWSDIEAAPADEPELLITNYESLFNRKDSGLKKYLTDFCDHCCNENVAVIVDESHKMKSLQSKQTKAIFQLKRRLQILGANVYCYLLSGTPFTTGYIDIYSQLKFLGMEMNKGEFVDRYCIRGKIPGLLEWQQPIVGYKDIDSLYRLIHGYALTIKSEEIIDLPEQIFVDHTVPCSESFKFQTLEKRNGKIIQDELTRRNVPPSEIVYTDKKSFNNPFYRNLAYPSLEWLADTTGTFWLRSRQASIGFQGSESSSQWFDRTRLEMLKTFLEDNRDNYVIFYNYTPELQVLYPLLEKLGYNIDVYCGPIKSTYYYDEFCKRKAKGEMLNKCNVILANFASGSTGMNWQEYNKCIIFSLPLYKDYAQAIKRIHRIGQKETVIYHRFYQDNWLDNNMLKALNEQIQYSEDLFKADIQRINQLTSE